MRASVASKIEGTWDEVESLDFDEPALMHELRSRRSRRCGTLALAFLIALGSCPLPARAAATNPSAEAAAFKANSAHVAFALSQPIAGCVARRDTSNPAFHGCIDWHSAVHGTWALTAYTRVTKDQRYLSLIDSIVQPQLIAQERSHLDRDPTFEMPYGRSWFLRLALDYHRTFGSNALDAFGDDVAASLMSYYTRVRPDPASYGYDSASWALINLYDYGIARHDARIVDFVRANVNANFVSGASCPLQVEVQTGEFMSVCTNWAWLAGAVLPRNAFARWAVKFFPDPSAFAPIVQPATVHQSALNFSRAWGFWHLYRLTGDPRYEVAYLHDFGRTYGDRQLWDGPYALVAHWVAQYGMFALVTALDDWPPDNSSVGETPKRD